MSSRALLRAAGAVAVLLAVAGSGHAAGPNCEAPPELAEGSAKLPHLAARLHARGPITIVAIGGASTMGAAAGNPDLAYPHRLQLALAPLSPDHPISVLNRGVPRQTAQQMLARFPDDVFAAGPVLVVWEAGIVEAVRSVAIDDLTAALQEGIDELKKRRIDIILVDMQFSRKANAVIDFERYVDAVHRVGDLNEVYVFPRYAMMRYWSEQHMFNPEEVAEGDRASLAAKVYDCIGRKVADAIKVAVQ